ncbi:winged helix-turn-helix transcriptional regulator [Flavobacterium sp. MMLR14_040]
MYWWKWKTVIVYHLEDKDKRYSELRRPVITATLKYILCNF